MDEYKIINEIGSGAFGTTYPSKEFIVIVD